MPALLLYRGVLDARDRLALAFFCATELPLVVAITTIAIDAGEMRSSTAAGLVGAAMLSTLIYPFVGLALRRRTEEDTGLARKRPRPRRRLSRPRAGRPRLRLVSERRRFDCSRRSREAAVAFVGSPALAGPQRRGDPLLQALDGELPVARLAAGVLGDRGHPGPNRARSCDLLRLAQARGRVDVEHRLDPRRGDVGVLAPRPGGAGGAELGSPIRE